MASMELCGEEEEEEEKALFVDSNLGTHLAISVSPDFTVSLLKGKLAYEHYLCFPEFGEIKVQKVMVKQNSILYQLPDSMVIKCAFQGLSKSWFIHMETTNSLEMKAIRETGGLASDVKKGRVHYAAGEGLKESAVDEVAASAKGTNLSESLSGLNLNKDNLSVETGRDDNTLKFEVSDENGTHVSEETSVRGIIFRYFCESDEMSSCSCRSRSAAESDKITKARKISNDENERSSNAAELNAKQSKQDSLHVKKRRCDIPRKRKKFSSSMVTKEHKTNRHGAMVNSTPTSTRRVSSLHLSFDKHMDASNRISGTSVVGERLVQAANSIGLSANTRQSPISLLSQKLRTSMPSNSAPSARHLAFEIDDNED